MAFTLPPALLLASSLLAVMGGRLAIPLAADTPPLEFVRVPGGQLLKGSKVRPFLLQTTEVTQRQWRALLHSEPSGFANCDDCPVESINWTEAAAFANALSRRDKLPESYVLEKCRAYPGTGTTCKVVRLAGPDPQAMKGYRLPTENEWAWAAAGARRTVSASHLPPAGSWLEDTSRKTTHPVGRHPAQALGLYDMAGNVWEWCHDVAGSPRDPAALNFRVVKGGSWASSRDTAKPDHRQPLHMNYRDSSVGFRLARSL
ncbi:MAG: SUMF1/EgtB/PvdO family nonheme iron enzyme [Candidatus Sericytochromatia bacterium]|nr:SUMF1/EgtB/PvdO family nonheme iron enzyme [Candidatus Sericytochromatia bacterium]